MRWVVLVLLQLLLQTKAIYEDQAGSIDWLRENIGPVVYADFGKGEKTSLYVGTEENVVASISLKNGNIVWRNILQEDEKLWCIKSTPKGAFAFSSREINHESIGYARLWSTLGSVTWETPLKLESIPSYVFCSSLDKGFNLRTSSEVIQLSQEGAIIAKKKTESFVRTPELRLFTISESNLAILDESKLSVFSLPTLEVSKQMELKINYDSRNTEIIHIRDLVYTVKWSSGCAIVNVDKSQIVWQSSDSCVVADAPNSNYVVLSNSKGWILSESGDVISKFELQGIDSKIISKLFVNAYKKDSTTKYAILVSLRDGSLHLIKDEKISWTREEALGQIIGSEFVDLPIESIFLKSDPDFDDYYGKEHNIFESYSHRFKSHANLIISLLSNPKPLLESFTFSKDKSVGDEFIGDELGIKKLAILFTKPGKIFGVATSNGNVKWGKYLEDFSPSKVVILRSPTSRPGLAVLVGKKGSNTVFHYFDPINGEFEEKIVVFDGDVPHLTKLASTGIHHTHYLLAFDQHLKAHVLPEPGSNVLGGKELSFFIVESNSIRGYKAFESKEEIITEVSWSVTFSKDETVEAISQIPHNEKVASIGRILGNRQVLYKYINPHMFAVATVTKASSYNTLTIYVIDSITGQILVQRHHPYVKNDVHLVISENYLVYHFWNDKDWSHQFVALEMYESIQPDVRVESNNFTSLKYFVPEVLTQSYVLPAGVTSLSVSQTRRGITSKLVLVGLTTDQLYGIPKRFLDPRRPYGSPSNEDKEEGLIPYDVVIPVNLKSMLSYSLTISKIKHIVASPALLESTSLVLAYGLDLFSTRVTPSQTFDSLTDEFQYETLILTILGLGIAWIVTAQLSKRAQTNQKWL